jgi:hypothetical protein
MPSPGPLNPDQTYHIYNRGNSGEPPRLVFQDWQSLEDCKS